MQPFSYLRPADAAHAQGAARDPRTAYIAGGTRLVDLMRLDVLRPESLVDLGALPLARIEATESGGVRLGALASNTDVAYHPLVVRAFPALSLALLSGASPQLRNMATVAGNVMQKTRCSYYRDLAARCNKRAPGSGCDAQGGVNRMHAILGGSSDCIALHPSDMCVALAALDAMVHTQRPDGGTRAIAFTDFHTLPGAHPEVETVLTQGELITHIELPATPFAARSTYVKVRDRTIMTQIAADALSMPVEAVRFDLGDTAYPETPVSGGSMTASSTGSAVKMASLALVEKLVAMAVGDAKSPLHGLRRESIDADDGQLVARGDPSRRDRYAAILARAGADELSAEFKTDEKDDRKRYSCHAFGAVFAEVRVDDATAEVRVARLVGAYGAGRILNPKTARSQFIGGLTWAIGMALLEETRRDTRSARVVTRDLAEYHVPVCADVPAIEVISIPEDDPHVNEIGAKGIGEIGITGASAAIANAVFHATGKRVRDLPITLDKLL